MSSTDKHIHQNNFSVSMPKVKFIDVFPAPRDKVWKIFELHLDDTIKGIHPNILSQKIVSEYNGGIIFERTIRSIGRTQRSEWKYQVEPPHKLRWDVVAGEGPFANGSYVQNTYTDVPGGTQITTDGEVNLQGIPGFLQGWIVRRVLGRLDNEDLSYLQKNML